MRPPEREERQLTGPFLVGDDVFGQRWIGASSLHLVPRFVVYASSPIFAASFTAKNARHKKEFALILPPPLSLTDDRQHETDPTNARRFRIGKTDAMV
jgi:hypothetical protein